MRKIPSLDEVVKLVSEAYKIVKPKYIDEFEGLSGFIGAVEYAYESFVNAKDSDKFWEDLDFFTWGILIDKDLVSDCKEALEILTLNGKDCELKTLRQIVDEAGLIPSNKFDLEEIKPIYLAEVFLSSAYAIETEKIFEKAKELWLEKQT